jgi:hypothetical protein
MADIVLNRATYIEFPDNPEIDIRHISIESGSLLLEEILCDGGLVFGETNATRFEATIYNLEDVAGLKIKVYQTDIYGNNRRNLFEGYVDSCKQDRNRHYRKLVAYDAIYSIGKANVAGWWLLFWNSRETATLKELRESLCDWVGIRYDTSVNLHNDGFICTKTANLSSVSFNTMLFWIGEIQCAHPHIDRDGILRFISLTNPLIKDVSNDYERDTSEFEGFVTAPFDTVELYDYNDTLIATTNSTGAVKSKNIYAIKNNSLLFGLTEDGIVNSVDEFVYNYLAQIQQVRYTPCKLNMIVSDLDLGLGDYISAGDVTSIILQNTLSGNLLVEQEIRAAGDEYSQESSQTPTAEYLSIEKRTDHLRDEIITDDLLNYSHTNKESYIIENVVTPIINIAIDMPKSSNLVFLATINLESECTETREVHETIILNGEECEIIRKEKVPVIVETFFEWNGAEILSNKPTETYSEDGKHLLNLMFFSIGGREIGNNVTFKVFITTKHGRIIIRENQVNATIISKGSSAGNLLWDGTITIDESIKPIIVGKRKTALGNILDTATAVFNTPTESPDDVEIIGEIAVKARTIRIDGISDSVETSTSS